MYTGDDVKCLYVEQWSPSDPRFASRSGGVAAELAASNSDDHLCVT